MNNNQKFWLFRSEAEPNSGELRTSQIKPFNNLADDVVIRELENLLSGSALAVAKQMAESFAKHMRIGDKVLITYKRYPKLIELAEVTGAYSFSGENHSRKIKSIKTIFRDDLPDDVKNKILRKPRIVAEIDKSSDIENLFLSVTETKIDIQYPLRKNLTINFTLPQDITRTECLRLSTFFKNLWPIEQKIRLFSWNINQSCLIKDQAIKIPAFVFDEIKKNDVDVFVLLEVFNIKGHIEEYKRKLPDFEIYYRNTDPLNKQNEILIGVRRDSTLFQAISFDEFSKLEQLPILDGYPNSLRVDIIKENKKITVIGVRVMNNKNWEERAKQFTKLINYAKKLDSVIIFGDFNHGAIKEEVNIDYKYQGQRGKYSYQQICRHAAKEGFTVHTPDKGVYGKKWSWVMEKPLLKIKEDHLLLKNLNFIEIDYYWDYLHYINIYQGLKPEDYKDTIKLTGNPDHAILIGVIEI